MTSAITFLLVLTLTGSPAATLTCVAACASAHDMDMDMDTDPAMTIVPTPVHIADVMESCGMVAPAIVSIREGLRGGVAQPDALLPQAAVAVLSPSNVPPPGGGCTTLPFRFDPGLSRVLRL